MIRTWAKQNRRAPFTAPAWYVMCAAAARVPFLEGGHPGRRQWDRCRLALGQHYSARRSDFIYPLTQHRRPWPRGGAFPIASTEPNRDADHRGMAEHHVLFSRQR